PIRSRESPLGVPVGLVAGTVVSFALLARTHYFYVDAGSALEMRLPRPLTLDREQVTAAMAKAADAPPTIVVKRLPSPSAPNTDHGTCYTPGTPGTPDIVIPGTPAIGDSPGTPPTVIPGIPPTPAMPHPCP